MENIKKTWKGIKSIISLKCKDSDIPEIIRDKDIVDSINKFFYFVAANIQSKISFAQKSFNYFLKNSCNESIFI